MIELGAHRQRTHSARDSHLGKQTRSAYTGSLNVSSQVGTKTITFLTLVVVGKTDNQFFHPARKVGRMVLQVTEGAILRQRTT